MSALLHACGLAKTLGGRELFRNLDLHVTPGETILLVGRNGSGKSTLIRTLAGELEPDSGFVEVESRPVNEWSSFEREERCPHVDQDPLVELDVPAIDNLIDFVALGRGLMSWISTPRRTLRRLVIEQMESTSQQFGLNGALVRPARELSYGQRRLLAILRALRPRRDGAPRVLLLDEPLAGLGKDKIEPVLFAFRQRLADGWGIIVAEHTSAIRQIGVSRVITFPANHG